jgi:hypothetical protein
MPTQCAGPTLCVSVWGPVYWRKAKHPDIHIPDPKGEGDGRLRLLNAYAGSFNKLLPSDIAVSSDLEQKTSGETRGARILREACLGRMSRIRQRFDPGAV